MQRRSLAAPSSTQVEAIRKCLTGVGFTERQLIDEFESIEYPSRSESNLGRLLYLTRRLRPIDVAARLFIAGSPADEEAVRRAFGAAFPAFCEVGLLECESGRVEPLVALIPSGDLCLAFDIPDAVARGAAFDHVLGITTSGWNLRNAMVPWKCSEALDLGTGCGLHAFTMAPLAGHVVATDKNTRATEFTRFNAALNGITNVEIRPGDLFEPVANETFGHIVTNLPFVISPGLKYQYRDSGERADSFMQRVVHEAPRYLEEGGFFQIVLEWAQNRDEDWRDRLKSWIDGSGCDAWVFKQDETAADLYAQLWVKETEPESGAAPALYREWISYLESCGIASIGSGTITMRRVSSRPNWIEFETLPKGVPESAGLHILRRFVARDWIDSVEAKGSLMEARVRPAPELRLDQVFAIEGHQWKSAAASVHLEEGIRAEGRVDASIANFIAHCDGSRTVAEALRSAGLSQATDGPLADVLRSMVSGLVQRGLLVVDLDSTL